MTHFTQEPSRLDTDADGDAGVLRLQGGGFLTASMVEQAWSQMQKDGAVHPNVLIDVRDVAGYDNSAVQRARTLLRHAPEFGVQRIAFVANSTAVRTATRAASTHSSVALRTFHHERSARDWLEG